jgi:hypothetical protein
LGTPCAARIWGIIRELAAWGLVVLGDKGYLGEDCIRTPYRLLPDHRGG